MWSPRGKSVKNVFFFLLLLLFFAPIHDKGQKVQLKFIGLCVCVCLSHCSSHIQPLQTVNTPGWLIARSSARDETGNLWLRDRSSGSKSSAGVLLEPQAAGGGIMAARTRTQSDRNAKKRAHTAGQSAALTDWHRHYSRSGNLENDFIFLGVFSPLSCFPWVFCFPLF